MAQAARLELRPMGVGDILDIAFRLYRARLVPFLTTSLIVFVPYTLVVLLLHLALDGPTTVVQTALGAVEVESSGARLVSTLERLVYFVIVWPLIQAALVYSISGAYLGEALSAGASYRRAAARVGSLVGTEFLATLFILLGLVALIVPGIYLSLSYMIIAPVVLLEGLGGGAALSRSKALMKGNLNKGFMLGFVVGVLNLAVGFGAGACLGAMGLTSGALFEAIVNLVNAIVLPFAVAPAILLYYDLRIRKEAFDLQRLSETLAGAPTSV